MPIRPNVNVDTGADGGALCGAGGGGGEPAPVEGRRGRSDEQRRRRRSGTPVLPGQLWDDRAPGPAVVRS